VGVVSGIVTKNGRPVENAKVSVSVHFGTTDDVRTDRDGRFTVTWGGNWNVEKLFVNGYCVARDLINGSNNVHVAL
jgi:hypothetical protein